MNYLMLDISKIIRLVASYRDSESLLAMDVSYLYISWQFRGHIVILILNTCTNLHYLFWIDLASSAVFCADWVWTHILPSSIHTPLPHRSFLATRCAPFGSPGQQIESKSALARRWASVDSWTTPILDRSTRSTISASPHQQRPTRLSGSFPTTTSQVHRFVFSFKSVF